MFSAADAIATARRTKKCRRSQARAKTDTPSRSTMRCRWTRRVPPPDGRPFVDVRDFKRLLPDSEAQIARNLTRQLTVYATGAPVRFSDRPEIERILRGAEPSQYGVRRLVHGIVQSALFLNK